jgi:hypothetical protein
MSSVWRQVGGGWEPVPVPESAPLDGRAFGVEGVHLVRFGRGSDRGTALLARGAPRVNGQPVLGGLRVLEHADEVILGRVRFFFSAESTPVVVVFRRDGDARSPTCPLCRGPIRDGEQAVQCPGCSRWFHQTVPEGDRAGKPCWTYAPSCRFCNHPTSLSGEPAWRPEAEEAPVDGR